MGIDTDKGPDVREFCWQVPPISTGHAQKCVRRIKEAVTGKL
jgi:hypothetical protein